jgi:hypothetical protein
MTPTYKFLKQNGVTIYSFPGTSDVKATQFSKFVLLDLPKYDPNANVFNFEEFFSASPNQSASNFADSFVESLRNYVANHEVSIRESKVGNEYFYDNNIPTTPAEKIFWKWCHKLGLMDFERALPNDEYFDNLQEFERNNLNDDAYLPEYLWKEREVTTYNIIGFTQSGGFLQTNFSGQTNFRVGDRVVFSDINSFSASFGTTVSTQMTTYGITVSQITGATSGDQIIFQASYGGSPITSTMSNGKLSYNRLVQYIGEISAVNNVQEATRSWTEVYSMVAAQNGQTPDILFRTMFDNNYKPNLSFPISPSQIQPEIYGAESFDSPIVSSPFNYPGDYYGQFDTDNFTYETSSGDYLRRTGDYFGAFGDINGVNIDTSSIDGVTMDFDQSHYVKMNTIGKESANFDEFNAQYVDSQAPKDFNFNAVLWFYDVTDVNGNISQNLYGITLLDHPDNNPDPSLSGLKIPTYKKLVAKNNQNGTSYIVSLNLDYDTQTDNLSPQFTPTTNYNLFSFELFNDVMKRLSVTNDSFMKVLSDFIQLKQDVYNIRSLIYTQTDINTINSRIDNLEDLLNVYKTLQIQSSDSIQVSINQSTTPPFIQLDSIEPSYKSIYNINTTDLYNSSGIIPYEINVPIGKNFLVKVSNNDETNLTLPNNNQLTLTLDADLDYKQSFDIIVQGSDNSTQNKKLNFYVNFDNGVQGSITTQTPLLLDIDLPVYFNADTQKPNTAKTWKQNIFDIDFSQPVTLRSNNMIDMTLRANYGLAKGDTLLINNLIIGTPSNFFDYSGQYLVDFVSSTQSVVRLDVSSNTDLVNYIGGVNNVILGSTQSKLQGVPYLQFNQGYKYRVTRVTESDSDPIETRYLIEQI